MSSLAARIVYGIAFRIWRPDRVARFCAAMHFKPGDTILDVGGTVEFWRPAQPLVATLDVLNLGPACPGAATGGDRVRVLAGDGCDLPFGEDDYAAVFSNSVIEHVGSFERQSRFAREVRRVGVGLWVQTPAKAFPFEPHFWAFFVQYLPWPVRRVVCRWLTPRSWFDLPEAKYLTRHEHAVRLLTWKEMKALFPDCQILVERVWGLPKSYVAFRSRADKPGREGEPASPGGSR